MTRSMSPPSAGRASPIPWLAVVLAATFVAYSGSLRGELQFDDDKGITTNAAIKDLGRFGPGELAAGACAGSRVVTDLTLALNYAAGGVEPLGYRLANLAIHLAVVLLVFAFTRLTLTRAGHPRPEGVAIAVAAVFALH